MHTRIRIARAVAVLLCSLPVSCALLWSFDDYRDAPVVADARADSAGAMAGSRLVLRTWTGDDGSRGELPGWHDTALGIDCAVRMAADGHQRCLPMAEATWSGVYDDAGCKVRLVPMACSVGLVSVADAVCPPVWRAWHVGTVTPRATVYTVSGGICTAENAGGGLYAALGAEEPAGGFVGGVVGP